jgi:uncharacterized protein
VRAWLVARRTVLIVPRWGGSPEHDFYPWLEAQLAARGVATEYVTLDNPPTITAALASLVPRLERAADDSIVLGHSVGVQAAMRALASANRARPLAGLVAVAGWFGVDRPWAEIVPWIETKFEHVRVPHAVRTIRVLISNDDPFTADAGTTRRLFEERLGADVEVVPGNAHFNAPEQPAVLRALHSVLDGDRDSDERGHDVPGAGQTRR